jgi:hypothetical protein
MTSVAETDAHWLAILPRPPDGAAFDDGMAEIWMRRCFEAGGPKGLDWAWQAENWPLGSQMRGRMFHVHAAIQRSIQHADMRAAEQSAREQAQRVKDARDAQFRAAGWR